MTALLGRLLLTLVFVTGAIAGTVGAVSTGAAALTVFRFEQEAPASLQSDRGLIHGQQGFGPLERDVVTLMSADEQVRVIRLGDRRAQWPYPEILVGEHGARYADEPAHEGAWIPFAVAAALGLLTAALAGWLAVRTFRHVLRTGGGVIFGQRDPQGPQVPWLPGGGPPGGTGGQVTPFVP
jgi:hypothetical protein